VRATGGGATRTRALELALKQTASPLHAEGQAGAPDRGAGGTATFAVRIARGAGFDGSVSRRILAIFSEPIASVLPTSTLPS
jgi:hypothetical protein